MIESKRVKKLYSALDKALEDKQHNAHIIIMGGGALISANLEAHRKTMDLDVAFPDIDSTLKLCAEIVAKDFGLAPDWLNSAGQIFAQCLPAGWKDRSLEVFAGKNLKIFRLSNEDLIFTKCLAYFDRVKGSDLDDLRALNATRSQIREAKSWLLKIREKDETPEDINMFFKKLMDELDLK